MVTRSPGRGRGVSRMRTSQTPELLGSALTGPTTTARSSILPRPYSTVTWTRAAPIAVPLTSRGEVTASPGCGVMITGGAGWARGEGLGGLITGGVGGLGQRGVGVG